MIDCAMACQLGHYKALLEVLGADKFNKLFSADGPFPMKITNYKPERSPLMKVFLTVGFTSKGVHGNRPLKVGDQLSFANVSEYRRRHSMMGECQGMNVVVLDATPGQQKFLGLGLSGKGVTEAEIEQHLIDEYNKKPLDLEPVNDALANELHQAGKIYYKALCDYMDFNASAEVKQTAFRILTKYHPEARPVDLEKELDGLCTPLTKENNQDEGFGYVYDGIVRFNIPLIQKLIEASLNQISKDFVMKNRGKHCDTVKKFTC